MEPMLNWAVKGLATVTVSLAPVALMAFKKSNDAKLNGRLFAVTAIALSLAVATLAQP